MGACAAIGCKNRPEKGSSMYRIPKDEKLRKLWLKKINRKNYDPPPRSGALCQDHFDEDQFLPPRKDQQKRSLKPDAVPTIFYTQAGAKAMKKRKARLKAEENKVTTLTVEEMNILQQNLEWARKAGIYEHNDHMYAQRSPAKEPKSTPYYNPDVITSRHPFFTGVSEEYVFSEPSQNGQKLAVVSPSINEIILASYIPENSPNLEHIGRNMTVRSTNPILHANDLATKEMALTCERLKSENQTLKGQVIKQAKRLKKIESALEIFNPDEQYFLIKKSMRGMRWSEETMKKAMKIRMAVGFKGYTLLTSLGYPLPCVRSLQKNPQLSRETVQQEVPVQLPPSETDIVERAMNEARNSITVCQIPELSEEIGELPFQTGDEFIDSTNVSI